MYIRWMVRVIGKLLTIQYLSVVKLEKDIKNLHKIELDQKESVLNDELMRLSINKLKLELSKDKSEGSYYHSWQSNIAMAFVDELVEQERKF